MKPLVEEGHIYIAFNHLCIKSRKRKSHWYVYSDAELTAKLDEVGIVMVLQSTLQRFSEMNLNNYGKHNEPDNRTILQVSLEDSIEADKNLYGSHR